MKGVSTSSSDRPSSVTLGILLLMGFLTSVAGSKAVAQIFTEPDGQKPPVSKPKPKPKPKPIRPSQPSQPERQRPQQVENRRIDDPAAYCVATGDVDEPRSSSATPDWIDKGTRNIVGVRADAIGSVSWRCMDRKVYACFDGGGSAHCQKPDSATRPRQSFLDFCRSNPNSGIPVAVTGMTVAIWECRKGRPVVARYDTSSLDRRGFYKSQWDDVTMYAPGATIGAVPGIYIGKWSINADGKGLLSASYLVGLEISGGSLGSAAGKADYFIAGMRGTREFACTSSLVLKSASATALEFDERIDNRQTLYCPKPRTITVTPQGSQLVFSWSKIGDKKRKTIMAGVGQR